ncbi:MAG TPA: UDP-N-acetylmuramoyl-L-alanyl-D-glutamate--2,6-diaminopimelate ligase [Nitrospirota bacterium]|nr:UDP-N-acetylmuramoyl-L-alanyl-D-glutamate--2,6-diaminopimelate ligase [Nitrospirota bacterium]
MKLRDLLKALGNTAPLSDAVQESEVTGIAHDSRKVVPGSLFVAVRGFNSDGHQFIPQAVKQGAVAVVAEAANPATAPDVPIILVPDTRKALAALAAFFYGHPSRQIKLVGITGTKGKTTTSYLVKSIIEAAGHVTGLIGTIDYRVGNKVYAAPNTTPESTDLQRLLREMADIGAEYCVMEVSSHALALGRTAECLFETAVFTNLQEDHLDFHENRESYFQAKLLLFTGLAPDKTAIINDDDTGSREITARSKAKISTFGLSGHADIHPDMPVGYGIGGLSFSVQAPQGIIEVASPLVGKHNVYNILAAIGAASALGFDANSISQGIARMRAVPGRMEKIDEGQPFGVVVDYAHTEESLASLLETVREVATGLVITVFGCGGDRDRTKRPKMGAAALKGSDVVIVTSDNPRTEDPIRIIREIEAGMTSAGARVAGIGPAGSGRSGKTPYLVNPDRREAIATAIGMAKAGDVVVLAGKGHEDYQIIGEKKIHFDDREVAREEIKKRQTAEVG